MKNKNRGSNMPIGKLTPIEDFLPAPAQLAVSEDTQKITICLKKSSISFFKQQAQIYHTKYQRMIRDLVDRYAANYSA